MTVKAGDEVTCTFYNGRLPGELPQLIGPATPTPTVPIPVPQVQAPDTGAGPATIRPPSTGDGGLASSDGSAADYVLAAMVIMMLSGFVALKMARD